MRKQMKMGMRVVAISAMMAVLSICAYASPNVMPDGQTGFADGMAGLAMYGDGWASGDSITIELENGATATWSLAS